MGWFKLTQDQVEVMAAREARVESAGFEDRGAAQDEGGGAADHEVREELAECRGSPPMRRLQCDSASVLVDKAVPGERARNIGELFETFQMAGDFGG